VEQRSAPLHPRRKFYLKETHMAVIKKKKVPDAVWRGLKIAGKFYLLAYIISKIIRTFA